MDRRDGAGWARSEHSLIHPLTPSSQNDRPRARAALIRLLQLGGGLGVAVAAAIIAGAGWLPSAFTSDPAVAAAAAAVLPVVALLMPLAPCGAAMEGALFGAMRVGWVGGRTVGACAVSLGILALSARVGGGLVGVWIASSLLLFSNAAADAWLLFSPKWSPVLAEDEPVAVAVAVAEKVE